MVQRTNAALRIADDASWNSYVWYITWTDELYQILITSNNQYCRPKILIPKEAQLHIEYSLLQNEKLFTA